MTQTDLLNFIWTSPTPAHVIDRAWDMVSKADSTLLDPQTSWSLQPSKLYAIRVSERSFIAFRMPRAAIQSFAIAAAHSDSPCFRLKTSSNAWEGECLVTGTEPYGGVIYSTWIDRTLRVAGTVAYQSQVDGKIMYKNIELSSVLAVIPSLAIHLNRDINKGYEFNPQTQLRALIPLTIPNEAKTHPWEWLACQQLADQGIEISLKDIVSLDFYVADSQQPTFLGKSDIFAASRIDNLAGSHAILSALTDAPTAENTVQVACLFDHEEVGSRSTGGADSLVLPRLLERIWVNSNAGSVEERFIALEKSFMLSVDVAHARHPNFPEKHDPDYAPRMGNGPVLKMNVNQRYATSAETAARFVALCRLNDISLQHFTNRADMGCGSTIGPALSSLSGISTVDVGIPILAMHSIREMASFTDHTNMIRALSAFFEGV